MTLVTARAIDLAGYVAPLRSLARNAIVVAALLVLVVVPVLYLIFDGLVEGQVHQWSEVFIGPLSTNLFWRPVANSLIVATMAAALATFLGALLACFFERTDMRGRKSLRILVAVPFLAPSFALAMAWSALFDNDRIGGSTGLLQSLGLVVDDRIAWGLVPITIVLALHYFPLAFYLISGAMARTSTEMLDAAKLAGARPWTTIRHIIVPGLKPAFAASALICFVEAISNFSVAAILGLPTRFVTLSTQLYRLIENGQSFRGSMLLFVLTTFSVVCLIYVYRRWGHHQAPLEIEAEPGSPFFTLGRWRSLVGFVVLAFLSLVSILPILALFLSSLSIDGNILSGNWTSHFWLGSANPDIAQGQPGVLRRPIVYEGLGGTIIFGLAASVIAAIITLFFAISNLDKKETTISVSLVNTLCLLPAMIPSIGLGAAFLALYGGQLGPFPTLYGSIALLVMIGVAATLPYAMQTAYTGLASIPRELEEAAMMAGAGSLNRLTHIILPLTLGTILSGIAMNFSRLVRNLDLVILAFTPITPLLAVLAYRFSVDGFPQYAYALALIIVFLSLSARAAATKIDTWFSSNRTKR